MTHLAKSVLRRVGSNFSPITCVRFIRLTVPFNSLETHYDVLEVERTANSKEIREAYIKKCKEFHPDKNVGQEDSDAKFKRITEAYETLSDVRRRADYDNSFPHEFSSFYDNPNIQYREIRTFRERAQAYGFPDEDPDYFRKFSPVKIAILCMIFAVGSFFVHFYIAYLGYEKHIRNLNRVKDTVINRNNEVMWMNYASAKDAIRDQEYTEEAIEERKELDFLQQYEQVGEYDQDEEKRDIDPFRRYKRIKLQ